MYGLIISISILISSLIGENFLGKNLKKKDVYWGTLFWTIVGGIVGARIYHVIDYIDLYRIKPWMIFEIWKGGLGIFGAIIGGTLAATVYLKIKKENILEWLDIAGVITPLAQSIGRWANFFNNELYGKSTELPWGINIKGLEKRPHPLFLYESILNFILFCVLYKYFKEASLCLENDNNTKSPQAHLYGIFFFMYLAGYSAIRIALEPLKIGPWQMFGLNIAQSISILLIMISIFAFRIIYKHNKTLKNEI